MPIEITLKHKRLIKKANEKFGDIYPTSPHKELEDGFTYENKKQEWFFWFNTVDGSTHIVKEIENAG